ncbi:MAG: RpiB/LacA/LacB family sugar-phosphate isomerase [Candidatus Microgenomates bacterium]|jgi:RpiB/LacA/LacB family sugar-phosphate isomerase
MKIYIGADHRGYELKEKIKSWLTGQNFQVEDLGAHSFDMVDDYTGYAAKVASAVSLERGSLGLLFCASGMGMSIMANKFDGVRSATAINPAQVASGRKDDDINVLSIASEFSSEDMVKQMISAFLHTNFSPEERFLRRLNDIKKIETNN